MMKNIKLTAVALVAALFSVSSFADAPVTDVNVQTTHVKKPTSSTGTLSQFNSTAGMSVTQRLSRLERIFNARSQSQIQLRQELNSLSSQLADLNGKIEQQEHQIKQIVQRQRDIYQEIDRRFAQLKKSSTDTSQAPSSNEQGPVTSSDGRSSYDAAVRLVMQDREFSKAIPAFESFLKKNPKSPYVPNAHYWLGQLLYTQGNSGKAADQFAVVVNQYPKSNKVPESLLKLGQIALQKNNKTEAIKYFRQVLTQYPNTSAAALARPRLNKLVH
ncbi:MAG: Cell division coordinator CpoB [Candidatus Celerinatantimonas neptuna]|nr:MAG: Cell division coordinator CpoB [Candidatus Celerinatantimonas neptuna]